MNAPASAPATGPEAGPGPAATSDVLRWRTRRFELDLSQPRVMGIVNLTPDSFSDGGRWDTPRSALVHAEQLVRDGADLLDLGAESTRPGAAAVPAELEWQRIEPVLRVARTWGLPLSIDTTKTEVMARALDAGADLINDVQALQAPGALAVVAAHRAGACLMHMRGTPSTMQTCTRYDDVVGEVADFFRDRLAAAAEVGIDAAQLVFDPGIGFAKTPGQNVALHRALPQLAQATTPSRPLLVGWSRKSTLGWITGRPVGDREPPSLAAALSALYLGARVLRVHDVRATVDAVRTWQCLTPAGSDNAEV